MSGLQAACQAAVAASSRYAPFVTLDEVAKLAKVSKSTVSRVMNGQPGPALATVQRVTEAIQRCGYAPPPIYRRQGMAKSRRNAIRHRQVALVMLDRGYEFHPHLFVKLLVGIGTALADLGLNLVVANHLNRLPPNVQLGMIDGMLLAGSEPSPELMRKLPSVPAVWLTSTQHEDRSRVMLGNEATGDLAAEYLLKQSRGPIGYVSFGLREIALQRRTHTFSLAVEDAGRTCLAFNALPRPAGASAGRDADAHAHAGRRRRGQSACGTTAARRVVRSKRSVHGVAVPTASAARR